VGLVLYRFSGDVHSEQAVPNHNDNDSWATNQAVDDSWLMDFDDDDDDSILSWLDPVWPVVVNQTSYTLQREQVRAEDICPGTGIGSVRFEGIEL
jgi:hypothetical protein